MTKIYTITPLNNLNLSIIGTALATNKSEVGVLLNTTTLEAAKFKSISPLEKTLSNCVLGSYIASAGASIAAEQLVSLASLTEMDPSEMIDGVIDQLSGIYTTVAGSREMISEYET